MSSKLKNSKPARSRRNTTVADNSRRSVMAEARKTAGGRGTDRSRANMEHLHEERIGDHAPPKAMVTLEPEDSPKGRPSRKSTRRSANHAKPNQLTRRTQRALRSPEARARRARAAEI